MLLVQTEVHVIKESIEFLVNRIAERLWVKPLLVSLLSVSAAFAAKLLDVPSVAELAPPVEPETVEALLQIMASSMLLIATLAVTSMVSAYASASNAATPRSFALIVADDLSQNALSTFVGAFIFSIVALIALKSDYYGEGGRFILFTLTLLVFAWVLLTFVRWVDGIARLGRIGNTVDKIEAAAGAALQKRKKNPLLGGRPVPDSEPSGNIVFCNTIGYVQHIRMDELDKCAGKAGITVRVMALPGTFATPARALACFDGHAAADAELESTIAKAFIVGDDRVYDDDPRFGLVVLSEIACRALSPAVNDPGTAIDIIGTFVRLFCEWGRTDETENATQDCQYKHVQVPGLVVEDMFDDAFNSVSRDGAGMIEVVVRLQKALHAIACIKSDRLRTAAIACAEQSLERARQTLQFDRDIEAAMDAGRWIDASDART